MELIIFIALVVAIGFFPAIWAIISVGFWVGVAGFGLYVAFMAFALAVGLFASVFNLFSASKKKVGNPIQNPQAAPVGTKRIRCKFVADDSPVDYLRGDDDASDDTIPELMSNYYLDHDEAEHVREIMDDEGLDEEDAVELKDEL